MHKIVRLFFGITLLVTCFNIRNVSADGGITVDSTGNVGVGIANPGDLLHVDQTLTNQTNNGQLPMFIIPNE